MTNVEIVAQIITLNAQTRAEKGIGIIKLKKIKNSFAEGMEEIGVVKAT